MKERYIRNNQSHIQPVGATFSVTLLAHDAVPAKKLEEARRQRDERLNKIVGNDLEEKTVETAACHQQYYEAIEQLLDAKNNQTYPFRNKETAKLAMDYIMNLDGKLYHLEALCVMSNHLHMLLDLSIQVPADWDGLNELENYVPLSAVVGRIKGGISYHYHKEIGEQGPIWAPGYYDRCIRSSQHFHQEQNYIVNNPVKAGIVSKWSAYPYTYLPPQRL